MRLLVNNITKDIKELIQNKIKQCKTTRYERMEIMNK